MACSACLLPTRIVPFRHLPVPARGTVIDGGQDDRMGPCPAIGGRYSRPLTKVRVGGEEASYCAVLATFVAPDPDSIQRRTRMASAVRVYFPNEFISTMMTGRSSI